jgi:hypothetical protein
MIRLAEGDEQLGTQPPAVMLAERAVGVDAPAACAERDD